MKRTALIARFRLVQKPFQRLPFGVRSIGHYRVSPPFKSSIKAIPFVQFFWGVSGKGIIEFDGRKRWLGPKQVAIYKPGDLHKYYAADTPWEFFWLTLDGPLADVTTASFGLNRGIYNAPPAPKSIFNKLLHAVPLLTRTAEIRAATLAFRLLSLTTHSLAAQENPVMEEMLEHINRHWRDPELNIKTLAVALSMDRSAVSRRFKHMMGITLKEYLSRLRLQHGLSQLENTPRPINDIALACGYRDPDYFSRLVRRLTGLSCREFRAQHKVAS